jgi:hypothetical protein
MAGMDVMVAIGKVKTGAMDRTMNEAKIERAEIIV